jgi:hypothetical protein
VSEHQTVSTGTGPATGAGGPWLAGVYELNALGEAWLAYDVLARGTTQFADKAQACSPLGISFDGDTFTTTDREVVARALRLPRVELLNHTHGPGQLAVFVRAAPHLNGAGLMTFAASDDQRSIEAMTRALLPARNADEARTRLLAAVDGAKAAPERDAAEQFLNQNLGVPLPSVDPQAARAAEALRTLTDDFRGYWSTYVGNTHIGLLHTARWATPNTGPGTSRDLIRLIRRFLARRR